MKLQVTDKAIVVIRGQVGSGKTPIANWLVGLAESVGKLAMVIDHRVFEFEPDYEFQLTKARTELLEAGVDLGIICVGTGLKKNGELKPFTIEIQPHQQAVSLLNILDPWDTNEPV